MGEFLGSIISDIFGDLLKNSSKKLRYFVVTICELLLMTIFVIAFIKNNEVEVKIILGIFMLIIFILYLFAIFKIHKSTKIKKIKHRK